MSIDQRTSNLLDSELEMSVGTHSVSCPLNPLPSQGPVESCSDAPRADRPEKNLPSSRTRVLFSIPGDRTAREGEVHNPEPCAQPDCGDGVQPYLDRRRKSSVATLVLERFIVTRERRWSVAVSSFIASLLALLIGFTIGFPSSALLDLRGEVTELPQEYRFQKTRVQSSFAALAPAGAVFGGLFGGWVADHWGRKCTLLFCGVPYLIGYLTISYAHYTPNAMIFKAVLLTGRFITGLGMGWASAVAPVYIAEISSTKIRGIFGALTQAMLTSGILINYVMGAIDNFPYYYISLVAVALVAVFEVLMIWLPETPRWLLSRGYGEDSESVLLWLRGKKVGINQELEEMKASLLANKDKKIVWRQFRKRSILVPFIYGILIFFFQQAGGVNAVASYASTIFTDAGVSNPRVTAIYAVGCSSFVGNIPSFVTIDLVGRKTLLIFSGIGTFLGTTMLGIHFYITRPSLCDGNFNSTLLELANEPCNTAFGPLAIVSLIIFRFAFAIGWGPIPWVLLSELLPLSVRGVASGFAMSTLWSMAAIVTGFYLDYAQLVQPWFAMWTFSLFNLASALFVFIFIPETKGKSLEEIERKFVRVQSKVIESTLQKQ